MELQGLWSSTGLRHLGRQVLYGAASLLLQRAQDLCLGPLVGSGSARFWLVVLRKVS